MISCYETVAGERLLRGANGRGDRQELNRLEEFVGDSCELKDDDCVRLVTLNINSVGQTCNNIKDEYLKSFIKDTNIDIFAFQELNVCWAKVAHKNKMWERFKGWEENFKLSVAYNTTDKNAKAFQPGGTAIMTIGKVSHMWDSSGVDKSSLGRWTWTRYQGSGGRHVRVISIYKPVPNIRRCNAVYMQQYTYSLQHRQGICPKEMFYMDLKEEIIKWKEQGDGIIVLGDFNTNVQSQELTDWKESLTLHDVMIDRLGENKKLPPTYNRGQAAIDTILCTPGISVRKAGYLPFSGLSDHRAIFADFTIASTLGVNLPPPKSKSARRLKTMDPRVMKKYTKCLKQYFKRFGLLSRIQVLQNRITYPLSKEIAESYEKIDKIRIQGMKFAEKNCRKLPMGGIPWTPELTQIRLTIEVWTLVIKRMTGCNVSTRTILRKKKKAGLSMVNTNVQLDYAQKQLNDSFIEYKKYLENSTQRRQDFLHSIAQARAKENKIKVSKEVERMVRTEQQRTSAKRIRRMNGSLRQSGGLTKVVVQDDNGLECEVVKKEEMEQALLQAYEVTLTQANVTPCMQSPLYEHMGPCGNGDLVTDILMGNELHLEGVSQSTLEVLKYLQLKEGTKVMTAPTPLCREECQSGWKGINEGISSAMKEGTHYGHWKVGYMDDEIADVHVGFANVPFLSGYTPNRWKYGINSIIPKEHGNYRINRLRTILLYEADYNYNNKVLGRRMMHHAEAHNILAPEQYGSRKNITAIVCALNKRLMFDILRQTKTPAGICSCDLHSCYDRVIHPFASVAMQRAGAPAAAIESMFGTIQRLKHVVRTCHGDSTSSFGGEDWREINPLHGVGQGNGAGPAIWAVISTVFFDLLRDKGYGFKMRGPLSQLAFHLAGCGFVDDTDLIQIGLSSDDYIEVAAKLQDALSWWEVCTDVSGGAVVPHKSWYGLVHFEWNDGEWSYSTDMPEASLQVKDMKGKMSQLQILDPHEAKRMLGVFLAIDGSNNIQHKHMRNIAERWYDQIRAGHLNRYDAWMALTTTVMKTLEYPLLASTLTEKECTSIMAPILTGGLPKMGVSRSMARDLVYAPLKYQGLSINNLYTTQGLEHIMAILDHMWRNTETGKLMRISMEVMKIELGIRGSLFQQDYEVLGHLCEDTWIKHLWKFAFESGIQIDDDVEDFSYARENDTTLTSQFAIAYKNGCITKSEWKKANLCRLYMKVLTVGDIATGHGLNIDEGMRKGIVQSSRARKLDWPNQGKPKKTDWYAWSKVLKVSLLSTSGGLLIPLGQWCNNVDTLYETTWEWWWDNVHSTLYRYDGSTWYRYFPVHKRKRRRGTCLRFKSYITTCATPNPQHLMRSSVLCKRGVYTLQGFHTVIPHSNQNEANDVVDTVTSPSSTELMNELSKLKGEQWALRDIMMTESIDNIVTDIAAGTAVAVSDGSYKDSKGTASWIVENASGTQRIVGRVVVPGYPSDQSAYRSEIAGLYGVTLIIEMITKVWGLPSGSVIVGCDGKSALKQAMSLDNVLTCKQAHFDLLSGIQGYVRESKIKYVPHHIKGHQDKDTRWEELDRYALLNVETDFYAKDFWMKQYGDSTICHRYFKYQIPKGMWSVSFRGTRVVHELKKFLRESIAGGNAANYWVNHRKRFSPAGFLEVDWDSMDKAMSKVSLARRQWVTKFESGICGTGRMMKRWKKRVIDNCPRCGCSNETTSHVLKCKAVSAVTVWDKSIESLEEWLRANKTCPDLRRLLLHIMDRWRNDLRVTNISNYEFDICNKVYVAQELIGWRQMLGGCLTIEWAKAQQVYYEWLGIRKTGRRWVTALILKLWQISWDLWDDRNEMLHKTPLAADLSGAASLDLAISKECQLGSEGLPPIVRSIFPRDINELLQSPLVQRKSWFVMVRAARELINDTRIQDEFTDPQLHLRKWVGLQ